MGPLRDEVGKRQADDAFVRDDDQIDPTRKLGFVEAERLANQPFRAVPNDGVAELFRRDDAEARPRVVTTGEQHEERARANARVGSSLETDELGARADMLVLRERVLAEGRGRDRDDYFS